MRIEEIGPCALNYVRKKARQLIEEHGFPWSDFEDLQQAMLLDLIQRLPDHDPAKSPPNAFITMVVNHRKADIIGQRLSPSREHVRGEVSINIVLEQDGRPVELGDTLLGPQTGAAASDRVVDLEPALASLPESLRLLWDLKVQGLRWTEISTQTGVPRPTLHDRWAKVCEHLRQAGLGQYFDDI